MPPVIFELMHDYPRYTIVAITFALGIGIGAVFLVNVTYQMSHRVNLEPDALERLRRGALVIGQTILNMAAVGIPMIIVFHTTERYAALELTGFEAVATLVIAILLIWVGMRARYGEAKPNTNSES